MLQNAISAPEIEDRGPTPLFRELSRINSLILDQKLGDMSDL